MVHEPAPDHPEESIRNSVGVSATQAEGLSWGDLLKETYGLYTERFWQFFRIAFLPVLVAYLFQLAVRFWIMPLVRLEPGSPEWMARFRNLHWYDFYLTAQYAVSLAAGAVYWMVSAFLFGAVAGTILGEANTRPPSDAFTTARQRIGPILAVSLLAWTCFTVSSTVGSWAAWTIIEQLHLGRISGAIAFTLPYVLICGLLSRLGLAVPWLIDDPASSFSSALRNSIRKTENWEPFFMIFVMKSAIAGFAFFWLAGRALSWLWQRGILTATLDPWVTPLVYISLAAALETPLFIAFSILYREKTRPEEEALSATAVG